MARRGCASLSFLKFALQKVMTTEALTLIQLTLYTSKRLWNLKRLKNACSNSEKWKPPVFHLCPFISEQGKAASIWNSQARQQKKHVGLWLTTIFGAFTSFWVFELAHPILALHIFFPEPTVSFNLQEPGLYWNPEFCLLLFVHPHLMFITICCGLSFPS